MFCRKKLFYFLSLQKNKFYMQIQAKIVQILPLQTGTGRNGEWKKQDIIVETFDQYPKKICISIWGNKIDNSVLQEGNNLDISVNIESREFNGKWYTDVKAWKIELQNAQSNTSAEPSSNTAPSIDDMPHFEEEEDGEVPF